MSEVNSSAARKRDLATLKIGELMLAVPLSEVQSLDPVLDVIYEDSRAPSIGHISVDDTRLPVFSLDSDLVPRPVPPESHRICALLGQDSPWLGLICDAVTTLNVSTYEESPVPDCLRTGGSPIINLLLHRDRVVCATDVEALVSYLELPEFGVSSDTDIAESGAE